MASAPPVITVGLPVYNGEKYLGESLDSILAQDFGDFEVLVADNASSDRTAAIVASYASRDTRVRYLGSDTNRGAAWNYNRLVDVARGRYFKWASDDDLLAPSFLRRCFETLKEAPQAVLAYPRTVLIDASGGEIGPYDDRLEVRELDPVERLCRVVGVLDLCNAVFGLFRLCALRRTGRIRPFVSSDVVLLAEMSLRGEIRRVPEALFYRRRHPRASRFANRTWRSVAAWFDPQCGRSWLVPPRLRLIIEHVRMIHGSPLERRERLRCTLRYLQTHAARRLRVRGGRYKRALKRLVGAAGNDR